MASIVYSARVLNDFVLHYEPLSYEPVRTASGRWKRATVQHQSTRNVQLAFRAHNREFRLRLRHDRSAFSEDFTLQMQTSSLPPSLDHLYSGHVMERKVPQQMHSLTHCSCRSPTSATLKSDKDSGTAGKTLL
ncbi:disintegrin and metalloproteinase domain-containing protein 10-like [Amblyomma americanum]